MMWKIVGEKIYVQTWISIIILPFYLVMKYYYYLVNSFTINLSHHFITSIIHHTANIKYKI